MKGKYLLLLVSLVLLCIPLQAASQTDNTATILDDDETTGEELPLACGGRWEEIGPYCFFRCVAGAMIRVAGTGFRDPHFSSVNVIASCDDEEVVRCSDHRLLTSQCSARGGPVLEEGVGVC